MWETLLSHGHLNCCVSTHMFTVPFVWDMAPRRWVKGPWRFERTWCPRFLGSMGLRTTFPGRWGPITHWHVVISQTKWILSLTPKKIFKTGISMTYAISCARTPEEILSEYEEKQRQRQTSGRTCSVMWCPLVPLYEAIAARKMQRTSRQWAAYVTIWRYGQHPIC